MIAASFLLLAAQGGPVDLPRSDPKFVRVDQIVRECGARPLTEEKVAPGDLRLRIWSGFAWRLDGFELARTGSAWSARRTVLVRPDAGGRAPRSTYAWKPVPAPKNGWAAVWADLDALGVRTMPDEASLPSDGGRVFDGTSHLFEIREGDAYRAYFYDNPALHPKKPQSRKVAEMVRILARALPGNRL